MNSRSYVMSVAGRLDSEELGITLIHEHLHLDATPLMELHGYDSQQTGVFDCCVAAEARWNPGVHLDNYRLTDVDQVTREVEDYRSHGGVTIVDCTPKDLGRSPAALQEICRRTGVNVIMGCGYYVEASHSRFVSRVSSGAVREELIAEIENGVDDTEIRPGIIGEIGTANPISTNERRVLRGAAQAALDTGLPLTVHIHPWGYEGTEALEVATRDGLPPDRVLLNHMNTAIDDHDYLLALLQSGGLLGFDLFGFDHSALGLGRYVPSDYDVALKVVELVDAGYIDQIFLSQDVGVRTRLRCYGGWGYSHLLRHVVPVLRQLGLSEGAVDHLLRENPRRFLSIQ